MHDSCVCCGSKKIIHGVPLLDHYGGGAGTLSRQAEVVIDGETQAWVFKDTISGKLALHICGEAATQSFT